MADASAISVSVIVPCWNISPYIAECLDSILKALPTDGEVIVVDDGSTDDTSTVLDKIASGDSRVRVIHNPHRGVSAARNAALDVARGEYIFFVDGDDVVENDYVSTMIAAMREKKADYCLCAFAGHPLKAQYDFTDNASIIAAYLPRIFGYSFDDVREWYRGRPLFANRELAGVWRGCFRRDIIERNHIRFDETIELYEDSLFNAEYLLHCERMISVDRPLYIQRDREDSAQHVIPKDAERVAENKLRLLKKRLELDRIAGGKLRPVFAASCVFSALEILSSRSGRSRLTEYLAEPFVRESIGAFPLSIRHPLVALGVLYLRRFK